MKFKLKSGSGGAGPILSVEADKDDELAYVDAERVYRGDLDSFLPFTYDRGAKAYEFSYYLSQCISLDKVLVAPVAPEMLRSALGSLLHMMQVCEANGLSRLRVVLDSEHVYYDPTLSMLRFVYVPVRSYASSVGETGLISRICSAPMADEGDRQFAVSVWDFVHRTTILTSVAFEAFLKEWGLQSSDSGHKRSSASYSALGADTRADHGWDFVAFLQQEERRAAEQAAASQGFSAEMPHAERGAEAIRGAILVRISTGEEFPIGLGGALVGRSAECEVVLRDAKGVSRKHAQLHVSTSECVLRDLDSTNGVFVDGERLASGGEAHLTPESSFMLGGEEFKLRFA